MAYIRTDWKDKVVQYPHRYSKVDNGDGTFTFTKVDGVVTESGTPINAVNLNKIEAGVETAGIGVASYLAFCGNVNANMLDAAFGKNNEDMITGLGRQLAMYAWFKGDSKITYPFTNLITCNTFNDCLNNGYAFVEILDNSYIKALVNLNLYAKALFVAKDIGKAVAVLAGLNPDDYADMEAVAENTSAMEAVAASATAITAVAENTVAANLVAASTTAITAVVSSALALNAFVKSNVAKTALITNHVKLNTLVNTMIATMTGATDKFTRTGMNGNSGSAVTIGSTTSFVHIKALTDTYGVNGYNWMTAKHNHNATEIIHAPFPTSNATGTVSPNVFAVGGFIGTKANSSDIGWITDRYEAL